jgi:Beta-lactamase class C and other penicillin binding proteins
MRIPVLVGAQWVLAAWPRKPHSELDVSPDIDFAERLMRKIVRILCQILCLVVSQPTARAETPGPLSALAGDVDRSAAQVLHVWTPEGSHSLATGGLDPGVRETRASDRFYLASVSKVAIAAAILRLHEAGEIDIKDAASLHLPEDVVEGLGGLAGVEIAHLLRMTSGLPEYMSDAFFDVLEREPAAINAGRSAAFAYGLPMSFAPGTDFDYVNLNYVLAQLILEEETGETMNAALQRPVLRPAGASRTEVFGAHPIGPEDAVGLEDGVSVMEFYAAPITGDGALIAPAGDGRR